MSCAPLRPQELTSTRSSAPLTTGKADVRATNSCPLLPTRCFRLLLSCSQLLQRASELWSEAKHVLMQDVEQVATHPLPAAVLPRPCPASVRAVLSGMCGCAETSG
jgi:hypothetical protein